jgi:hypothetical protein
MPPTLRRTSPAALAVLALLLGACGGEDGSEPATTTTTAEITTETTETTEAAEDGDGLAGEASDVTVEDLLEAVERTRASESAAIRLAMTFDGGSLLGRQDVLAEGAARFDGTEGDMVFDTSEQQGSLRIVLADGVGWIGGDIPEVRGTLPDGAEWAEVPLDDLFASDSFTNPGDLAFLYLVGGAQDIREDGDVLRFVVDLDAAVASAPDELREEVESTITFSGDGEPEVTGEVELDDEGRITSLSVLGIHRPTAEEAEHFGIDEDHELRITIDAELGAFDEPVDVAAPEGGSVPIAEAPELAAMLGVPVG